MSTTRIYDPEVEELASTFPRFDVSDAVGARAVLRAYPKTSHPRIWPCAFINIISN